MISLAVLNLAVDHAHLACVGGKLHGGLHFVALALTLLFITGNTQNALSTDVFNAVEVVDALTPFDRSATGNTELVMQLVLKVAIATGGAQASFFLHQTGAFHILSLADTEHDLLDPVLRAFVVDEA